MPDGQALCHCDFHAGNVFFDGVQYTIIDLLQTCLGDPAADAACSYTTYRFLHQELAEFYLNQYCAASGISESRVRQWLRVYPATLLGQVAEEYTPIIEQIMAGE
jgi:Ser/Thr protein kinase RdoA (MazF antagonist)